MQPSPSSCGIYILNEGMENILLASFIFLLALIILWKISYLIIFLFMSISAIQYTLAKGDRTGPSAILLSTILPALTMVPSLLGLNEYLLTV